ncbi:putative ankyrin repeat protein (4ank) [Tuber indicum]|nr:putative ankyrin repeat protein (4ank) [Tuber indicum]
MDIDNRTPLELAAMHDKEVIVQVLLEEVGADDTQVSAPDRSCETPLHLAARPGHCGIVEMLLKSENIEIHARNRIYHTYPSVLQPTTTGRLTPLHISADNGHANIAYALLEDVRTNPDLVDMDGETTLHLAARFDQLEVIEIYGYLANERVNPNT